MILQRNLTYGLCIVWVVSFVGLLTPYSIVDNISSGLLSGATIGILTSITQYFKLRSEYFAELYSLLRDYYKIFKTDEDLLRQSITFLREHNIDEIKACEGFKDFDVVNNELIKQYTSCSSHLNYHGFVSLNPFDKKSKRLFKSIDHEIWFAHGELIKFHDELFNVVDAQTESDIGDCVYSRTYLYMALASAIQNIYVDADKIGARFKLTETKEYKSWLYYADDVYLSVLENEDYLVYGEECYDEEDPTEGENLEILV